MSLARTFYRFRNFAFLALMLPMVLFFQNCSESQPFSSQDTSLAPADPPEKFGPGKSLFFPEASGFGSSVIDWSQGFEVLRVTKLSDTWPVSVKGELRHALESVPGPRIVVFDISGVIELKDALSILDSNIYIAGQTAPPPGITLKGDPSAKMSLIHIGRKDVEDSWVDRVVENVAVRHLRLRLGKPNGAFGEVKGGLGDNLTVTNGRKIILDHLSTSWSYDENISFWVTRNLDEETRTYINDVTLQNSLLSEPLAPHEVNLIIGSTGDYSETADPKNPFDLQESMSGFSLHGNVFTHASHRNPMIAAQKTIVANNIVAGWREYAFGTIGSAEADFRENFLIEGAGKDYEWFSYFVHQSYTWPYAKEGEIEANPNNPDDPKLWYLSKGSLHYSDNFSDRLEPEVTDGLIVDSFLIMKDRVWGYAFDCMSPDPRCFVSMKRESPLTDDSIQPYVPVPASLEMRDKIISNVGASSRVDCAGHWVQNRDSIDERVLQELKSKTSHFSLADENDVGGYSFTSEDSECRDSDNDGMPDEFESTYSEGSELLKPFDDLDKDGYPNLIEYINGTNPAENNSQ